MNYKEVIKEIELAVKGLSEEEAMQINMLDWISENLLNN